MGPVGKRHPERPTFLLVSRARNHGHVCWWLLSKEHELDKGDIVIAREDFELMGRTDWEPYFTPRKLRLEDNT